MKKEFTMIGEVSLYNVSRPEERSVYKTLELGTTVVTNDMWEEYDENGFVSLNSAIPEVNLIKAKLVKMLAKDIKSYECCSVLVMLKDQSTRPIRLIHGDLDRMPSNLQEQIREENARNHIEREY